MDRLNQLVDVGQSLLEQVGASLRAAVEKLEGVRRFDVLRQHHDADFRMCPAEGGRRDDSLVGVVRGHPDVGEHGVGSVLLDGREEFGQIDAQCDDVDVVLRSEQTLDPFADEQRVLGHDDSNHHRLQTLVTLPISHRGLTHLRHDPQRGRSPWLLSTTPVADGTKGT